jgi:hypothetical protein
VLVLHERKSRVTLAARLAGKTAAETISVMLAVFARVEPALRKSITFDNDTALAREAPLNLSVKEPGSQAVLEASVDPTPISRRSRVCRTIAGASSWPT